MERRVTLRDIVKLTGCHCSTVSRALRGDLRIKASTRATIQRIAREMRYRPDPMLKALAAYRTSIRPAGYHATLAWLSNSDESLFHSKYIFRDYLRGVEARATKLGYRLEEFLLGGPGVTLERLPKILRSRGITGIFVAPQPQHLTQTEIRMDWSQLPAVTFGYSLGWPPLHHVTNHHHRSVATAIHKLIDLGHRRIGLLVGELGNGRVDGNWVGGYLAEILRVGRRPLMFLRSAGSPNLLLAKAEAPKLKAWLGRTRPDALIIDYSPPFIEWLRTECRLRVPGDISVVSLNVERNNAHDSGIDQNEREIGAAAVDLLVNMIHTNERGIPPVPRSLLIEGTWKAGRTLRRAR